ncbi:ABC transporter ATP-binding protein [soil metagenome]
MSDNAITIESISKRYRLHHEQRESYSSLRELLTRRVKALLDKKKRKSTEDFWALRDVSFEVKQGEVVGVIGRNGSGKSTLLKILSRIIEPTTGQFKIKGRIASLLEVGTGFHPELTGRENIFLNGAILGMRRHEIKVKFDEIVAFAEVERFLDTPVKHYSSGMYVRLAFAVAAHLEPEILVVDEVLAVGDVEFQRKCMGKMGDVARGGRTVLFVSHNMAAVSSLTTQGIVLDAGHVAFCGSSTKAIEYYINLGKQTSNASLIKNKGVHTSVLSARLLDEFGQPTQMYAPGKPLRLEVAFETDGTSQLSIEALLLDSNRHRVALGSLSHFNGVTLPVNAGQYRFVFEFKSLWIASGAYSFDLTTSIVHTGWDHYVEDILVFHVAYSNPSSEPWDFRQSYGLGTLALASSSKPQFEQIKCT